MSDTLKRDQVAALAKAKPDHALEKARSIKDPWFRAQALAWLARFSDKKAVELAKEASRAACECDDAYKRVAVRAWEISALAESGHIPHAKESLASAVRDSVDIAPVASKAEALFLLLQAASRIGSKERDSIYDALKKACPASTHWRSKRALRDAELICSGSRMPRQFFDG